jgi:cystathionine beta-synthase
MQVEKQKINDQIVGKRFDAEKYVLQEIGNTPLVRLNLSVAPVMLAKLEYLNPGGSLKDRSALFMIEDAEKRGVLKPGGTIVEASSGNQGIAIAMIGAVKGYNVIVTVPDRTSNEKIATLRAYGAKVFVCPDTDDLNDSQGYHTKAEQIHESTPGAFMPNQYYNPLNSEAHYKTTGPEIWQQTAGRITHFFAGAGSGGTISGVGRYLKEQNPNVKIIGIDAATSAYSSKSPKSYETEGIGIDDPNGIVDFSVIDEILPVQDKDSFAMTRKMAKEYGFLAGLSSGAVLHAAIQYAERLTKDDVAVLIFGDSGRAYLSKAFGV